MSGWALPAVVLLASGAALVALTRLPRQRAIAAAVLATAAVMALMRQFAAAAPLALVGVELWRRGAGLQGAAPRPGQLSEVRTDALVMRLDHDSGEIDGEVLAGDLAGRRLSELGAEQLQRLAMEFEAAVDEDSLSLLMAYLHRRGGGGSDPEDEMPPLSDTQTMTRDEAYRILGLKSGAGAEEVRAAHHRLMRRVHPDLGGSGPLAAMINAAKELLDPG